MGVMAYPLRYALADLALLTDIYAAIIRRALGVDEPLPAE